MPIVWIEFMKFRFARRLPLSMFAVMLSLVAAHSSEVAAEADGPDFFRVSGIARGHVLNLRAEAGAGAAVIARMPYNTDGLRNLGCKGGFTFAQWQKASPAERERARHRRWCKVEYLGKQGWAAGWFLAEGSGPAAEQPDAPLIGTRWRLTAIADHPALGDAWMSLDAAGRLFGRGGCNRFNGTAKLGSGTMQVGPLATTRMACADPKIGTQENRLLSALSGELHFERHGNRLIVTGAKGTRLEFAASDGQAQ